MEPEVREFLRRIVMSIFIGFGWMAINTFIGIKYNYAFFEEHISLSNILFYAWFLASGIALGFYLWRLWRTPINF